MTQLNFTGSTAALLVLMACATIGSTGCGLLKTRNAQLMPQLAAAPSGETLPLRSATVVYRREATAQPVTGDDGVVAASYGSYDAAGRTDHSAEQPSGELQILAVRYPNPRGDRDTALVELVVIDPSAAESLKEVPTGPKAWHRQAGDWLREAMPGIGWSEGIREAKALSLPIGELQQLLEACRSEDLRPTASSVVCSENSELLVEVNGQTVLKPGRQSAQLDALVARVRGEGRLISYLAGSGAELAAVAEPSGTAALIPSDARDADMLIQLPPAGDGCR